LNKIIDLANNSKNTLRWSYNELPFDKTQKDWNQTLLEKIKLAISELMTQGDGNSPVCVLISAEVSAIFDDYENFTIDIESDWSKNKTFKLGSIDKTFKLGSIDGTSIYKNPYLPAGLIIVCFEDDLVGSNLPEGAPSIIVMVDGINLY